jgi:hypothetical protein
MFSLTVTPLGVVCYSCPFRASLGGRSSDLQATYSLSLPSSGLNQCSIELSFLLTAAGQFRIFTGFPFQADLFGSGATKYLEYS